MHSAEPLQRSLPSRDQVDEDNAPSCPLSHQRAAVRQEAMLTRRRLSATTSSSNVALASVLCRANGLGSGLANWGGQRYQ
jgi:hypothetical protein